MSDFYRETTHQGWFSRIANSFVGALVGIFMFFTSFVVLYMNEGMVDLSKIAKTAIDIEATASAPSEADGKLVAAKGDLKSEGQLGDKFLKAGDYISVERRVEMYAWDEESRTTSEKNIGGSTTKHKDYSYKKTWTESPESSNSFKVPSGHTNPTMTEKSETKLAERAAFGQYEVSIKELKLPTSERLSLNPAELDAMGWTVNEDFMYNSPTAASDPSVGDLRISYYVVRNPVKGGTMFGKLEASAKRIVPFVGEGTLYRAFAMGREEAIATMRSEYKTLLWILRIVGFGLMWFGLMAMFGPVTTFLDVLPVLGNIGGCMISIVSFVVALVLSAVTILISMILHNPIVLAVSVAGIIGGIIWYMRKRKKAADVEKFGA